MEYTASQKGEFNLEEAKKRLDELKQQDEERYTNKVAQARMEIERLLGGRGHVVPDRLGVSGATDLIRDVQTGGFRKAVETGLSAFGEFIGGQAFRGGPVGTYLRLRKSMTEPGHPSPPNMTIADLANVNMMGGFVRGLTDPLEKVPGLGPIVAKYTDPIEEELNQAALKTYFDLVQEQGLDPTIARAGMVYGQVTGSLAGWSLPFTATLRMSKLLFGTGLGLPPLVAEFAGGMTYGFAAKEPGLLYHLAGYKLDPWAKETHEKSFMAEMGQRLYHGVMFGGELAGLAMVFNTFSKRAQLSLEQQAYIDKQITGASIEQLVANEGGIITREGKILLPVITEATAAERIAQQETFINWIWRDPEAASIFLNKGQNYEAMVAAVKNMKQGEIGVMYNVVDPMELMTAVQRSAVQRAKAVRKMVGEKTIVGNAQPLTLDYDQIYGLLDKDIPVFLSYGKLRSKGPFMTGHPFSTNAGAAMDAKDFGRLVEVVIKPSAKHKIFRFKTWEEALYPDPSKPARSVEELLEYARSKNLEVIVVDQGYAGFQDVIPVTDDVIKAVGEVRPADAERALAKFLADPKMPSYREQMGEITALDIPPVEPMAVALARQFENMNIQIFRRQGEAGYNMLFWPKDVKFNQAAVFKQFKQEGFFTNQRVLYNNKEWRYIGRSATNRVKLQDLTDPKVYRFVKEENVLGLNKGIGIDVEQAEGFGRVFVNEFEDFLAQRIGEVADKSVGLVDLRNTARGMGNAGTARRDVNLNVNAILGSEEAAGAQRVLLEEATKLADDVRADTWDDILVQFPEPTPNEIDIIWNEFLASKGIKLSEGQSNALKWSTVTKIRQRLFESVDAETKEAWKGVERDLAKIFEGMPDTPQAQAAIRGWQWIPTQDGVMLRMPGTHHYKMFRTNKEALAYLRKQQPLAEELLPGGEYMDLGVEGGFHKLRQRTDPDAVWTWDEETVEGLVKLFVEQGIPNPLLKSMNKFFTTIENETALPFLNRFFLPIVKGKQRAGTKSVPFHEELTRIFSTRVDKYGRPHSMLSKNDRIQLGEFIRDKLESPEVLAAGPEKWRKAAEAYGLAPKQIETIVNLKRLTDRLFEMGQKELGWTLNKDYFWHYFARKQVFAEAEGVMGKGDLWGGRLPGEIDEFWAKYYRSGQLSQFETDPLIVFRKYINAYFFEREVGAAWSQARQMVNMRWGSLPQHMADDFLKKLYAPGERRLIQPEDYALPERLRKTMDEFLIYTRGYPMEAEKAMFSMTRNLFKRLGVSVNEGAVNELISTLQAAWYGAAIGWRPIPQMRNQWQNLFTLYVRLDGRSVGRGFERGLAPGGFEQALDAGAFKLKQRGTFYEKTFEAPYNEAAITGERGVGKILAPGMRLMLGVGKKLQKGSEYTLRNFGLTDAWNRVWAYHSQRAYLEDLVEQLQKGTMTFAKFEKKALQYWGQAERREFLRLFEKDTEKAIDYLGARAADISNFIYGHGAQPLAMQGVAGRLFGTFGTWPMWMKDLMFMTWKNGTNAERARLVMRAATVTGAVMAMGYSYGVDIHSWIAYGTPFYWAGGPGVSIFRDFRDVMDSPINRKAGAVARLVQNGLRLGFPGQLAIRDFRRIIRELHNDRNIHGMFAAWFLGRPAEEFDYWWAPDARLGQNRGFWQGPYMHPAFGAVPEGTERLEQNIPLFQNNPITDKLELPPLPTAGEMSRRQIFGR